MAETGARVFAFEPDPYALEKLRSGLGGLPNVSIIAAAAGASQGKARLYRSANFDSSPDRLSKSSSLFAEKRNVSAECAMDVDIIDFPQFLEDLDHDIALIKIDIEGAEVELLETLLSRPVARRIGDIFVETHERKLFALAARTQALRAATRSSTQPRVNWDWH